MDRAADPVRGLVITRIRQELRLPVATHRRFPAPAAISYRRP
jgi:hypothetical protein